MRLHELLRLVGGKKTVEVGACCVQLVFRKTFLLIIDTASCLFACLEFTYYVSTIGNWIALGFALLQFGDVVMLR